jgi:hypothetical protein
MANIISIDQKLAESKKREAALLRKRKLRAVQKVFQCTHCSLKCEKCGTQLPQDHLDPEAKARQDLVPYRFCDSCREEYLDYIERLKGGGDPDTYWHNDDWLRIWEAWIAYQGATDRYLKSKEFVQLLRELKEIGTD